jgi:hypothetical protein
MSRFEDPGGKFFGVASIHEIVSDIADQREATCDREFPPRFDPRSILDRWQAPAHHSIPSTIAATVPGDEDQMPWGRKTSG